MADLTITIQLIQQQAKAAFREFAAEGRRAVSEVARAHDAAEKQRTESTRRESAAQTAEHRRTTRQMIDILKEAAASSVGAAEAIRRGWETQSKSVASSIQSNIINPLKQASSTASALSAGIINPIQAAQQAVRSSAATLTAGIINSAQAQEKSDKDYVDAMKLKARALGEMERQRVGEIRNLEKLESQIHRQEISAIQDHIAESKRLTVEDQQASRDKIVRSDREGEVVRRNIRRETDAVKEGGRQREAQKAEFQKRFSLYDEEGNKIEKVRSKILSIATAYTGLRIVSEFQQMVNRQWEDWAKDIQAVRDKLSSFYDESARLVDKWAELFGYKGQKPTLQAGAALAQEAKILGITPEQWGEFQTQAYAQAAPFVGPGRKISEADFNQFAKMAAQYTIGVLNIQPSEGAQMLGPVLAQMKPGAKPEEMWKFFAPGAMATQQMFGRTGPMARQVSQVIMEQMRRPGDIQEYQGLLGMAGGAAAGGHPAAVPTYIRAVGKLYQDILNDADKEMAAGGVSRMQKLGVKPGMTLPEFNALIIARQKASGMRPHEFAAAIGADQEIREFFGAVAQFRSAEMGMVDIAEFFKPEATARQMAETKAVPAGEQGRRRGAEAGKVAARLQSAAISSNYELALAEAEPAAISNLRDRLGSTEEAIRAAVRGHDKYTNDLVEQEKQAIVSTQFESQGFEARARVWPKAIARARGKLGDLKNRLMTDTDLELSGRIEAEMQAMSTEGDLEAQVALTYHRAPFAHPVGRLIPGLGLFGGAGFGETRRFAPDSSRPVLEDMANALHVLVEQGNLANRAMAGNAAAGVIAGAPGAIPVLNGVNPGPVRP